MLPSPELLYWQSIQRKTLLTENETSNQHNIAVAKRKEANYRRKIGTEKWYAWSTDTNTCEIFVSKTN